MIRINNFGLQRGNESRKFAARKTSVFRRRNESSARDIDDVFYKHSHVEAETERDLASLLHSIERDFNRMGLSFSLQVLNGMAGHYATYSVDDFLNRVMSPSWFDGANISVDFVDGEPGDSYMLCFHGEDPDDMEECAQFLVQPR